MSLTEGGNIKYKEALLAYLSDFVTENRRQRFDEVVNFRTRYVTVVLEDIFQPHNASAVLRTCDCLGVLDVHIIENQNRYQVNPDVALGASQWLNLRKYNSGNFNTLECYRNLRSKGYRIVATTPHRDDVTVDSLDLETGKLALVFGTELAGLTGQAMEEADEFVKLPMYGFTESYNISVSAALFLYSITERLRGSGIRWELSREEKTDVLLDWVRGSVKRPDILEKEFRKKYGDGKEQDFL